jgi:AsmA protein
MKKVFKIIAALVSLLLVLLLAAVLIIPLVFNPNDYKGEIEQQVMDATGRELTIDDDIELTLFPWIGVSLGEVTLGNAAGFDEARFARIERAEVKLRLMPLLSQRVEASTVILHGLRLNLAIAEDGTTNWDDLAGEPASETPAVSPDTPMADTAAPSSPGIGLAALAIGGLHIEDAEVLYDDKASGVRYAVKQLSLKTGPVSLNAPLDVAFSSQFESSEPDMSGQLELKTRVQFDLNNERYSFTATTLDATVRGSDLPQGRAVVNLAADIDVDMQQQTAALSAFRLTSYGVELSGAFDATQILGDVAFDGTLLVAEFNPKTVMQTFEIAPPETADATAMSSMQLTTSINGTLQQYNLQDLQIILDQTRIEGDVQLAMSDAPMPAVKYALTIDQIDADRYLPPVVEVSEAAAPAASTPAPIATPASGAGAAASTLPMETLRELNVNGTFDIGKLKLSALNLSEIKTKVVAKAGVIRMHPISANLYQGQYQGDIKLDARGDVLKLALNEAMKQIHVGPLLKDYMGDDKVRGIGTVLAKLSASGETPEAITKTLNGTASIAFVDGAVKGVNIVQMIREAEAKLKGKTLPPASGDYKDTDFAEMKASFNITDGLVKNNDLSIKSPFIRVGGEGQVNLVTETIDYLVKTVITKAEQGQGGAESDALRGLTIPVRIGGTFDKPEFKVELGDLLKEQAKQALEAEKAKLKAELEQLEAEKKAEIQQKIDAEKARAEDKLKDKLKGLFGR